MKKISSKSNNIFVVTFILSILININAIFIVPFIGENLINIEKLKWGYLMFFIVGAFEIFSFFKLIFLIKNKYSKEKANSQIITELLTYLFFIMLSIVIFSLLFGLIAMLISSIFINLQEENIKTIINIIITIITTVTSPILLWSFINVMAKNEKTIKSIKLSISNIKTVYTKLFVVSSIYAILGYAFIKINNNFLECIINILLQTFIITYTIKLYDVNEREGK